MTLDLDNYSGKAMSNTIAGEASVSSTGDQTPPPNPPPKKKRNQAGMPDPDAEVIALSPKTLMATNRFVCEICNKGFQRDQNLQLHRRGHNLPWKLRQRSTKEVRKKVYVCPEPTCVHHDPSRALGDLTGIKKHFCRKHGEKKYKCEKCSKSYAVQSDWKAHSKICGTKEYKCDCGTMFARRDSFITHRAFCDALATESTKPQPVPPVTPPPDNAERMQEDKVEVASSPPPLQPPSPELSASPTTPVVSSILPIHNADTKLPESSTNAIEVSTSAVEQSPRAITPRLNSSCSPNNSASSSSCTTSSVFASLFASSTVCRTLQSQTPVFSNFIQGIAQPETPADVTPPSSCIEQPFSLCLSTSHSSIFAPPPPPSAQETRQFAPPLQPAISASSILQKAVQQNAPPMQPAMSATALLQKAAQMGATGIGGSLLLGLGLVSSSTSSSSPVQPENLPWNTRQVEMESSSLQCDEGSGLKELMMGSSPGYGPKHPTLDFLGLGMAVGGSPSSSLSALVSSMGGGIDRSAASYGSGNS
ncbi:hypothetical protein V2J09_001928 [Rumex salicifolius]